VLFNEPKLLKTHRRDVDDLNPTAVSVLFNEPKLLKTQRAVLHAARAVRFSALQRAEIAEKQRASDRNLQRFEFQCSSTSRNC